MKKFKLKFLGIFLLFFIAAVTPSCETLIQILEDSNTQVDDNQNNVDNNTNNNNGQTSTSKGKH